MRAIAMTAVSRRFDVAIADKVTTTSSIAIVPKKTLAIAPGRFAVAGAVGVKDTTFAAVCGRYTLTLPPSRRRLAIAIA